MSSSAPPFVRYEVSIFDAKAHLLGVEMTIRGEGVLPGSLVLSMPVWTPGSYLVREYARHVEGVSVRASRHSRFPADELALGPSSTSAASSGPTAETQDTLGASAFRVVKRDKSTWVIEAAGASGALGSTGDAAPMVSTASTGAMGATGSTELVGMTEPTGMMGTNEITVSYRVYAHDLTVRTNHVDATHAYWNGAATYLLVEGMQGASVSVRMPEGWDVATSLGQLGDAPSSGSAVRTFVAGSIDELLDAPFECGPMRSHGFELYERAHEICVWENRHAAAADWAQIARDTQRIVTTEAALIAGDFPAESAIPYRRYAFLWLVSPRGRGGLEHAESCSLLVSPSAFSTRAGYLDVLSLVAHEFLHLWNVKRIRPAGLTPYLYDRENYTRLLWWFEGATSYFDWRILRLAELCTTSEYATHLAELFSRLADTPGARMHSLSDASFDAWIKAYRPDESSVNTTVSYYLKGEIVCALLDIVIRSRSRGTRSMDDVLRFLWREFGAKEIAVPEDGMAEIFERATGVNVEDRLREWVESSAPVDVASVLALVGLEHVRTTSRSARGGLGIRTRTAGGRVSVEAVLRGSPAMNAGIEHGDEILAIAGRRIDDGLDAALAQTSVGDEVQVMLSREGMIEMRSVVIGAPSQRAGTLRVREDATDEQLNLLRGWLGSTADGELRSDGKDGKEKETR